MRFSNAALITALLACTVASAQTNPVSSTPASSPSEGPTAFLQFQGTHTKLGVVMSADIDVGYNLTAHLGGDAGLPFLFVRTPFSLVTNHDWAWTTLLGEPYIDVRYTTSRSGLNLTSVLTGTFPVSSSVKIFSTGRVGGDWFNHIEPESPLLKGFKPFVNFGASNGTVNRYYMPRPYSLARPYETLGFMADFEAGGSYRVYRGISVGASAYALVPGGSQKVFSRLVVPGSNVVGNSNRGRYFDAAFETVGTSKIDRDNGFSGWVELVSKQNSSLQIGYTRSVHYGLDSVSVMLNYDATSLIRTITGRK